MAYRDTGRRLALLLMVMALAVLPGRRSDVMADILYMCDGHRHLEPAQPTWRCSVLAAMLKDRAPPGRLDRKSTRLNSSHQIISYAVFCLKKKTIILLSCKP